MSYPVWRVYMDEAALQAHEAWLDRGKSGPGRLVLEDRNLQGARVAPSFPAARFVRCDLSKAVFLVLGLDELELVDCTLDESVLRQSHFERAKVSGTTFGRAALQLTDFSGATFHNSSFLDANLERSFFTGANLDHVSFFGARLVDAVFDDARFVDCDLRNCELGRSETFLDLARTTRTRFERCDLRGVKWDGRRLDGTVFDHCRMDGMTGKPAIEGPYSIISPVGISADEIEEAWQR